MQGFFKRPMKTLIRLRGCASWFESSLDVHVRRYVFSCCGSYISWLHSLSTTNATFQNCPSKTWQLLHSLTRNYAVRSGNLWPRRNFSQRNIHYESTPIQIYWNFTTNNLKFSDKNSDIFLNSAQNIDFGYSLESHRRGGSNEYTYTLCLWAEIRKKLCTPVNPSFTT